MSIQSERRKNTHIKEINAKCPQCEIIHTVKEFWTGRGMPRMYCNDCKRLVAYIKDYEYEFPDIPRIIKEKVNEKKHR